MAVSYILPERGLSAADKAKLETFETKKVERTIAVTLRGVNVYAGVTTYALHVKGNMAWFEPVFTTPSVTISDQFQISPNNQLSFVFAEKLNTGFVFSISRRVMTTSSLDGNQAFCRFESTDGLTFTTKQVPITDAYVSFSVPTYVTYYYPDI